MKISELENAPQWLKEAKVQNEDVEIINNIVVWEYGIWEGGIWEYGIWEGGIWEGGIWERGTWKDGIWKRGIWKDGIWKRGIWEGGIWEGGIWEEGIWKGGRHSQMSKYYPLIEGDKIIIGCKTKTIAEWDEWFNGDEEFETKRGTREFQMIFAHYRATREYILTMQQK